MTTDKTASRNWVVPAYSRGAVNRAGEVLTGIRDGNVAEALEVLENWRASHLYPLNTFQATLRAKIRTIDKEALVAQRLKRLPSIISKLQIEDGMKLARMQDIVGLRAVVQDIKRAKKLVENYRNTKFAHVLRNEFDYISIPKASGYRSHHLVYQYASDIRPEFAGLLVELQIRTKLQHSWAMAVETMGVYLSSSLKSGIGPDEWKEFFSVTGSAFARLEKTPVHPAYETLSESELCATVSRLAAELRVVERLEAFAGVTQLIANDSQAHAFFLIELRVEEKITFLRAFSRDEYESAIREYANLERETKGDQGRNVVLVSAGSVVNLKRAYPSYFLDTGDFLRNLKKIMK